MENGFINLVMFTYLKKISFFIILIFLFINCNFKNNNVIEESVDGVLDLSKYRFQNEDDSVIKLDGYWEFYWMETINLKDDKLFFNKDKLIYVDIPQNWSNYKDKETNQSFSGHGYAIYRTKVILNKVYPLAIKIPFLSTSYKFFIDDDFMLENGIYGITKEKQFPETGSNYVFFTPKNKEFYLTFFISNFYHSDGGFWTSIELGNFKSLINSKTRHIALDLFVAGILFIMGVYHLSLFYLQRDQKTAFYFGLFCLIMVTRTISTGENYLKIAFDTLSYEVNLFFIYMSIYAGLFVFNEFVYSLYPNESISFIKKLINLVSIILTSSVLVLSANYYTQTLTLFQIFTLISMIYTLYIFIRAIKNKRTGAKIFSASFIIFGIFIVNDILYANNTINTGYFLTYGFIMFIFSQSFLLTYWLSTGFNKIKELSMNLETKVRERTFDLNIANIQVEKSLYKSESLNEMISLVIESKNIDEIFKKIFELFYKKYDLTSYVVYVTDETKQYLSMYKAYDIDILKINKNYMDVLFKNKLEVNHKYCIHGACVRNKKPIFIKKVRLPHPYQPEHENIFEGKINSFYIIPLTYNEEYFGTITFCNNSIANSKIEKLSKDDREEIENFIKLVCPSIFQSLEKKELEKAYQDLKETQMQLIEAEKMASLGSLISSIAHEINNPIAMIKSQLGFIKDNHCYDLNEIYIFLTKLEQDDKEIFFEIADKCLNHRVSYSTKREREIKKQIQKELQKFIKDEKLFESISFDLLNIKLLPPYEEYFKNLNEEKIENFIFMISKFKNQISHIDNIEIAIDKVSRIVFSLKIFLNTGMSLKNELFSLNEVMEKTLNTYGNLILDKIKIEKKYHDNYDYFGKKENICQIINNLIFNSIQAIQLTDDKKIEIEINKVDNLNEHMINMYSSSDYQTISKEWITISITDSGIGIIEQNKTKIFSPFFTTKSLGEGVGLGLHISKKIIEDHFGVIFFESKNKRTQFIIALPFNS